MYLYLIIILFNGAQLFLNWWVEISIKHPFTHYNYVTTKSIFINIFYIKYLYVQIKNIIFLGGDKMKKTVHNRKLENFLLINK